MRLGYLIAGEAFVEKVAQVKKVIDLRGDLLFEDALAALFEEGVIQRHIRKSLKLYQQRRDLFCELLEKELGTYVRFRKPDGGMAVWVQFDSKFKLSVIAARAGEMGLKMSDGTAYDPVADSLNGLRMGFASLNEKEMKKVMDILRKVLAQY
ncbi:aminotransferase class I/II-fold pyridoxal phosphate-dependent enzyme [Chitinophaga pinensis]|uniref:Aminotransferase class I/II-fold pyridoxal phosphate-dependent enzyme n=1 Tax=Chitinophaga pinensis TaxID=79329 RepID=A0A5C6LQR7_9BACT|nr:aminotransferase class I/II-fold pyridoxal phosphate-dependent enzyme [Chitinophaga pinensis]TWV95106.1 aminotransferase class I/II-fold pyridoxal phosphate-dependent enzyme [Chitinophaga pinensis]